MSGQAPYLQRRGDTLSFRIAVPGDLRALIGGRELTKTLRTPDKRIAAPLALELAAVAKRLFSKLRLGIAKSDGNKLRELLIAKKGSMERILDREQFEQEKDEILLQHREALKRTKLEAENDVLKRVLESMKVVGAPNPPPCRKTLYRPQMTPLCRHSICDQPIS
jgi:hypothetical protein